MFPAVPARAATSPMSSCTPDATSAPAAPAAKPVQIVPRKSPLNAHGCGGDCAVQADSQARWPRTSVLELLTLPFHDLPRRDQQVLRHHLAGNGETDALHGIAIGREGEADRIHAAKLAGKRAEEAATKKGRKHADLAPRELTPADVEARKRRLKTLIVLGKERGYLTYAEINDHLPDDILDAEQIEGVISMITGRKVFDERIYYFPSIPTHVEPMMVFWVAFGAVLIAVMASILPARRAARLDPVRALRYE